METLLITLLTLSTGVLSYALVNLLKKYTEFQEYKQRIFPRIINE